MMERKFNIGETVQCTLSGVVGVVIKFYNPTACEEQTMVRTGDGRLYHAPTYFWMKINDIIHDIVKWLKEKRKDGKVK